MNISFTFVALTCFSAINLLSQQVICASLPQNASSSINSSLIESTTTAISPHDSNTTESRNSFHRAPTWTSPNLFGPGSLATLLDPLAPLAPTFPRLPHHPPPRPLYPASSSTFYPNYETTSDYSSTLPTKGSTPFASGEAGMNENASPGAMKLLYVCEYNSMTLHRSTFTV